MTNFNLQKEIEDAVSRLLKMVKELTVNDYSDNCLYIPFEETSIHNFNERREARNKVLTQATPLQLMEVLCLLQSHLDNLYCIIIQVYKATPEMTVIELNYMLHSALSEEYKKTLHINHVPTIHAQLRLPPEVVDTNEKFDINWRHKCG